MKTWEIFLTGACWGYLLCDFLLWVQRKLDRKLEQLKKQLKKQRIAD